jgi:asparagine synthase (glutamine-hydrolysing)
LCGFTGFAHDDPRGVVDAQELTRMTRTLVHRGPDDEGFHSAHGVGLGFRRLSIIDPAHGHQPLVLPDQSFALVGNGEIYNYSELAEELRRDGCRLATGSDMEVVLHLFAKEGSACFERLEGMFALAIVDFSNRLSPRVTLARDRMGIKPLYWARHKARLWFASEPKALLASGQFSRSVRGAAMVEYLMRGFVGGSESAWDGIERLEPGTSLEWVSGQVPVLRTWWTPPLTGPSPAPEDGEVLEYLDRAVSQRLVSDVPLGGFLSGGVDSAGVADAMGRAAGRPPELCTVSFREEEFDEAGLARISAERMGALHHVAVQEPDPSAVLDHLPWHFDEPHADPSNLPTWMVCRMAREHVTVALSGDGGDEVFGGYRRYIHELMEQRARRTLGPLASIAGLAGQLHPQFRNPPRWMRGKTFLTHMGMSSAHAAWDSATNMALPAALSLLHPGLGEALAKADPFAHWSAQHHSPDVADPLYRTQYADMRTTLAEQLLVKVDRASMAVGLEVRVPFLDHRMVERFAPMPIVHKIHGGVGKVALRAALNQRLDPRVIAGAKRGFDIPVSAWLRGPLAAPLREHLGGLPPAWFDLSKVKALQDDHLEGRADHGLLLWTLLVFEAWRRRHDCEEIAI